MLFWYSSRFLLIIEAFFSKIVIFHCLILLLLCIELVPVMMFHKRILERK